MAYGDFDCGFDFDSNEWSYSDHEPIDRIGRTFQMYIHTHTHAHTHTHTHTLTHTHTPMATKTHRGRGRVHQFSSPATALQLHTQSPKTSLPSETSHEFFVRNVCVCVCVFIFREGILATLSY